MDSTGRGSLGLWRKASIPCALASSSAMQPWFVDATPKLRFCFVITAVYLSCAGNSCMNIPFKTAEKNEGKCFLIFLFKEQSDAATHSALWTLKKRVFVSASRTSAGRMCVCLKGTASPPHASWLVGRDSFMRLRLCVSKRQSVQPSRNWENTLGRGSTWTVV